MPRNETCPKFSECLTGLGETEIDWHCDHCTPDDPETDSPDVRTVLRALDDHLVRAKIREIVKEATP
jgi:hypothetical protein